MTKNLLILILAIVAAFVVVCSIIITNQPLEAKCNSGYSEETKDGVIYKTYMPAARNCKR